MRKLLFLFLFFPIFLQGRDPFNFSKKEKKQNVIQKGLQLQGIAEFDGRFGAIISFGSFSDIVFVGDKFQCYNVLAIDKDNVVLESKNKKLNLGFKG